MRNRLLGWVMAVCCLWSCAMPLCWAAVFEDVPESGELSEAAAWAAGQGITRGKTDTRFCPGDHCTRMQILTFLWRYRGRTEYPDADSFPFTDVDPQSDYGKAALWAFRSGLLGEQAAEDGAGERRINGGAACRRKEVALYLWRLTGSPYADPCALRFEDVEPYAEHAVAVAWAVQSGITRGKTDTTFAPEDTCTRGQIVMFLRRYARNVAAAETA